MACNRSDNRVLQTPAISSNQIPNHGPRLLLLSRLVGRTRSVSTSTSIVVPGRTEIRLVLREHRRATKQLFNRTDDLRVIARYTCHVR